MCVLYLNFTHYRSIFLYMPYFFILRHEKKNRISSRTIKILFQQNDKVPERTHSCLTLVGRNKYHG